MAHVMCLPGGKAPGFAVINGEIQLPRVGAWHADLQIDTHDNVTGKVDLKISDVATLKGTISRASVYSNILRARIVAGGDGLRKDATPRHYTGPTIRIVLEDLAKGAGETLSAASDAAALNTPLEHWTTVAMPTGEAISLLLERAPPGTVWRTGADGAIWVGKETWPDSGIKDAVETSESPEDGAVELGLRYPFLLPGTMVGQRKVDTVEIHIGGGDIKTTILTTQ